jgi:hypothetical protein
LRALILVLLLAGGCAPDRPHRDDDATTGPEDAATSSDSRIASPDASAHADRTHADRAALKPDAFAGKPDVWIIGDSLAVGAGTPAKTLMGSKYTLTVQAKVGDTIAGRFPYVQSAVAAKADSIVIQAGINDVGGGVANVSQLQSDISKTLDATKGTRCVYWVTYQTKFITGSYTALSKSAPTLNQVIRSEVAKRPGWVQLIDFQPYIDAHPELNASDGLHLTTAGYQKLAQFYADALVTCFGF